MHVKPARRLLALVVVALVAVGVVRVPTADAALSNVSLVASNNQAGATGVTYTVQFRVGLANTALVVALPAGITGLDAGNVTVTTSADGTTFTAPTLAALNPKLLSTDRQRVAVNLAAALGVNHWVKIVITGLTNPGSAGDQTITVGGSLLNVTLLGLDGVLNTLLNELSDIVLGIVAVVTNGVTNSVTVAPALTFTVGAASHSWNLDPATSPSSTSVSDTLTVATNAASYVLQASVSGHLVRVGTTGASASDRIPYDGPSNGPRFGYRVVAPAGETVDESVFRTFSTSSSALASAWSLSGLTNSEVTTVTYDVATDYTKAPGTYSATVTYRIVPSY